MARYELLDTLECFVAWLSALSEPAPDASTAIDVECAASSHHLMLSWGHEFVVEFRPDLEEKVRVRQ